VNDLSNLPLPTVRLRRLRQSAAARRLFQESTVPNAQLVQPYFVVEGEGVLKETSKGSGLWHVSADALEREVEGLTKAGVGGAMLFGVPSIKSKAGERLPEQLAPLEAALKRLKGAPLVVMADVCLCSYLESGHCGIVHGDQIDNDESLKLLSQMAVRLGKAGLDFVSPSDMMDGRIRAMRHALDAEKLTQVGIISYAVKMASAFYGPFRDAAHSAPAFGDRKSYQMPASNRREARREWKLDVEEGADALLFKPALTNLDLVRDCREGSDLPIFAYQVSGEYAMSVAAANAGLLDFERGMEEQLVSMRRAGVDIIVTYDTRRRAGLK
jgi:porphobilinogen synthase